MRKIAEGIDQDDDRKIQIEIYELADLKFLLLKIKTTTRRGNQNEEERVYKEIT